MYEKWYLVLCRVNLILDKSGFKVLGKAFLSDFWFWYLVFWFWHFCLCESFHIPPCVYFLVSLLYRPVTLVKCPSFFHSLPPVFLFPCCFFAKVFWLSTLPSNSSVRVGLSFSIWKGINVHSQSSSVKATSLRCVGQFFGLNSPPLSCSLLIPVLFCSFSVFLALKDVMRERERERAQERNGGSERWLWLKRRVLSVFFLLPLWLPSTVAGWCGRHSAIAPPRWGGEALPNEQKEAGLEHGEMEQESGLVPLAPGGGEALGAQTRPIPALLARGSKVGAI